MTPKSYASGFEFWREWDEATTHTAGTELHESMGDQVCSPGYPWDVASGRVGEVDGEQDVLGLRDYLDIVRRRARLIATSVVAVVIAAAVASSFTSFTHRSSVELLLQAPSDSSPVIQAVYGSGDLATQQRLVTSLEVAERVAEDLDLETDAGSLRRLVDRVDVQLVSGTSVMVISAEHPNPEVAAAIPPAFAENFVERTRELADERFASARQQLRQRIDGIEQQLAEVEAELGTEPDGDGGSTDDPLDEFLSRRQAESRDRALFAQRDRLLAQLTAEQEELAELAVLEELSFVGRVISPVTTPEQPALWRVLLRNVVLGAILGGTLGIALAFVREWLEDRLVRDRDVVRITGRPILATVPSVGRRDVPYATDGPAADAYRAVRATVRVELPTRDGALATRSTGPDRGPASPPAILVTAVDHGPSGSEVAANLATAFARSGMQTLLVQARRRPSNIDGLVGEPPGTGLSEVLLGMAEIDQAIHQAAEQGLQVVPPGGDHPSAQPVLTAERIAAALRPLAGRVDVVVLDAGPISEAADAVEMSIVASHTILVATWEDSSRESMRASVARLDQVGAQVLGTVMLDRQVGGQTTTSSRVSGSLRRGQHVGVSSPAERREDDAAAGAAVPR
jgi:succinoglycan biosynthesis transport protein ExoP